MLVNNRNFNHLKVHTQYSICEGAIKIDELADYCKTKKIKSIGLVAGFDNFVSDICLGEIGFY